MKEIFWKDVTVHFAALTDLGALSVLMGFLTSRLSSNYSVIEYGLRASYIQSSMISLSFGWIFIFIGVLIFLPVFLFHLVIESKILNDSS